MDAAQQVPVVVMTYPAYRQVADWHMWDQRSFAIVLSEMYFPRQTSINPVSEMIPTPAVAKEARQYATAVSRRSRGRQRNTQTD
jgi:hypothetical protein